MSLKPTGRFNMKKVVVSHVLSMGQYWALPGAHKGHQVAQGECNPYTGAAVVTLVES